MSHCYRIIINRNKAGDNINSQFLLFWFLRHHFFSEIQGGHQMSWHQNQQNQELISSLVLFEGWTSFLIFMHHYPQLETFLSCYHYLCSDEGNNNHQHPTVSHPHHIPAHNMNSALVLWNISGFCFPLCFITCPWY